MSLSVIITCGLFLIDLSVVNLSVMFGVHLQSALLWCGLFF